jgi:hypothetical protein
MKASLPMTLTVDSKAKLCMICKLPQLCADCLCPQVRNAQISVHTVSQNQQCHMASIHESTFVELCARYATSLAEMKPAHPRIQTNAVFLLELTHSMVGICLSLAF